MRLSFTLASIAAVLLSGCASGAPYAMLDWNAFVESSPGQSLQSAGYAPGTTKFLASGDLATPLASAQGRFKLWCTAHGGRSGSTADLMASSRSVSMFRNGLANKGNAEQAQTRQYRPTDDIVCIEKSNSEQMIAAMVREQGRASALQGTAYNTLTLAFFDDTQAAEFANIYTQPEVQRAAANLKATYGRIDRQLAATRRLRHEPRVGDRTLLGTIIEVRPPLVLVQYDERYRSLANRPAAEWHRIDGLSAAEQ